MEMFIIPAVVAFGLLVFYLRVFPFMEKPSREPERTVGAKLIAREVTSGADRTGRSSGMGFNYVLSFLTDEEKLLRLYSHDYEYGALREGMTGQLTWKGRYFVDFREE